MNSVIGRTLEAILEHGSHAWRALEVAGVVKEDLDGSWPPSAMPGDPAIARHLAAMLRYTKQLYDQIALIAKDEGEPG